jgi:hypothetical protein
MHVLGWGVVVLGVCGVKPAGEGVLGTLARVSSKQLIWDWGQGYTDSSVYPYCDVFRSLGVGVLLANGGHELAPV